MPPFFQRRDITHPKTDKWISSRSHFSSFSPFTCCLSVICSLIKGIYPENSQFVLCPNKQRYFLPVTMCLNSNDDKKNNIVPPPPPKRKRKKKEKKKRKKRRHTPFRNNNLKQNTASVYATKTQPKQDKFLFSFFTVLNRLSVV